VFAAGASRDRRCGSVRVELDAEQRADDAAEVRGARVLERHRLVRVGVPGDEEHVEDTHRPLAFELGELVDDPPLEVRTGVEPDADELDRADL
jgi:hypothetical protein